jgi:hypothetical protein
MHRYREFGLFSETDELLRRAFRDGFKRAGLSFPQFLEALAWYRDRVRPGTEEAGLTEAFAEFVAERGWRQDQRDAVLDIYRTIREAGPAAVTTATPSPDEDRATLTRGDALMRSDPARYWADAELQDAMFEAWERLAASAPAQSAERQSAEADRDRRRVEEIEALLHDRSGTGQQRYWNDAALRAEYAQVLERLHGAPANTETEALPTAPAGDGGDRMVATEATA